jgi:hypothetical protein
MENYSMQSVVKRWNRFSTRHRGKKMQSQSLEKITSAGILYTMNLLASLQTIDIQLLDMIRSALILQTS